jgi:hypothetical protein
MCSAGCGFGPSPLGHDLAGLAESLTNCFGFVFGIDVNGGGSQRFVLTFAALVAICQNVIEKQSMAIADPLGG